MAYTSTDYNEDDIRMARFAKALSHPARIAIVKLLASMDTCFCGEIVEELPIAQATVSQHLKELKESGLIQGCIEPPKIRYCIEPENWKQAQKLFADFWKQSYRSIPETQKV
ncbi:MAG: metalloregulator ArsR/SmtB family transcription factor [Bacteroidota bacterium]|jgi:ArsR family transcriptional regulator, arsenate/arsenite/antimonite-responsive transcriptional repressor